MTSDLKYIVLVYFSSVMGMRTKGQGTLKFDNNEIYSLLKEKKWCCSDCNKEIKKNIYEQTSFSHNDRENPKWVIDAEKFSLQNYEDINVIRKKHRGTPGDLARRPNGELNYDNLLLLCHNCNEKRFNKKKERITFRTSKEKKKWLEHFAKDKGMAELMNDIIDKYRNNLNGMTDEEFLKETGMTWKERRN